MAACISFNNVSKSYGSSVAVSGLALKVQRGEVLGLLGPNGAGKSTSLYMLCGLVRPTSGSISVFGKDLRSGFVSIASRMGVLVERPAFHDYLSVRRTLLVQARLARRQVNVERILDMVGLVHLSHATVRSLSQGQRQRLGLAQAMLAEPELLILDEPTSGLDVESTEEVLRMLRQLADEAGVTIVFSSHLMHEVEVLCDRVAILNEGHLIACEKTDDLLSFDLTRVEVLVDGVEGASKRLVDQPWVASVSTKGGRLYVTLKEPNTHQLIHFLVNAGYQISGVLPRRRTLKDYFLKVMNG
jgi:ABC-2 type transport system ATP-binding protein